MFRLAFESRHPIGYLTSTARLIGVPAGKSSYGDNRAQQFKGDARRKTWTGGTRLTRSALRCPSLGTCVQLSWSGEVGRVRAQWKRAEVDEIKRRTIHMLQASVCARLRGSIAKLLLRYGIATADQSGRYANRRAGSLSRAAYSARLWIRAYTNR